MKKYRFAIAFAVLLLGALAVLPGTKAKAYQIPTGITATYGSTLRDVKLPEGFSWEEPGTSVGSIGEHTFTASYEDIYDFDMGIEIKVKVVPRSISSVKISKVANQNYTGKAIKPSVQVSYDGTQLVKGTDYTISYKNNKKIGIAKVTVKGKGYYTGTKTISFKIVKKKKTKATTIGAYKVVNTSCAYYRTKPTVKSGEAVDGIKKGKTVQVVKKITKKTPGKTYVWYQVKIRGKKYYMYGDYLKKK